MVQASPHKCSIIVLGDGAVGKTSILRMYDQQKFSTNHMATLGLDFVQRSYKPPQSNIEMSVKIWDTAGQERFRTLTLSFYKQAQGVIVTFDVTNQTSFKSVKMWLESIDDYADDNVAKILVGNKVDMVNERKISKEEAERMAAQNNMKYWETSAKENLNINELMDDLMNQVYEAQFAKQGGKVERATFKLNKPSDSDAQDKSNGGSKPQKNKSCSC